MSHNLSKVMQSLRLQNNSLARLLHEQLHKRMLAFCELYTPEMPALIVVDTWLTRLFSGDNNLHIHVNLDNDYRIVGHTVIDVQDVFGYKVVHCYQACADKGYTSTLDDGAEYVDKLVALTGAQYSTFTVGKHSKALEKKYGYKIGRILMIKRATDTVADTGEK